MELKTESGVSITIVDDGSSKVLIFDKSVRAIGLSEEETSKISALLAPNQNGKGISSNKAANSTHKRKAISGER
jgi:hypothetical protein